MKRRKNAGGIKQDESGHFIVRLNHNGKRYAPKDYTEKFDCRTLEETIKKVEEIKREFDKGEDPFDKRRFGEYFEEYLNKLKKRGSKTGYIYETVYNKYAKKILHNLYPHMISKNHIKFVYEDMVEHKDEKGNYSLNSNDSIYTMKKMLRPTFKKLLEEGKIIKNYLEDVEIPELDRHVSKATLNMRLKDQDIKTVAQKIYNGIQKIEHEPSKYYLLMNFMTMRRRNEILSYTWEHIYDNMIDASSDITKTKIDERFPIPEEIKEYLKTDTAKSLTNPFKADVHSFGKYWKLMLKNEGIEYKQSFQSRDSRNIFMSLMRRRFSIDLVGACISHHRGDINEVYNAYEFFEREEVFQAYWKILRGEE